MQLSKSLLPEFDHEMAGTRRTLERVPNDKLDWSPHDRSFSLRDLATHVANLPTWTPIIIAEASFDMAPPGGDAPRATPASSADELVETFDRNIAAARAALEGATDERLLEPWSLLKGGETVFTMPRIAVLRTFLMNHTIHHRAQLGVYLRLLDVPVPSLYGPTADESTM